MPLKPAPRLQTLLALAPLAALAACAGGGRPEPRLAPPPPLFISPAGEPFRVSGGGDALAAWFASADADHDGRLDRKEFTTDADRFFAALDVNGDGRIDVTENNRYEHLVAPEIIGERGVGRPGDSERGRGGPPGEGRGPEGRGGRGGPGGGPGGFGGGFGGDQGAALLGAAPYGLTGEPEPVRAADRDFSQSVSRAEFLAHADELFGRLDEAHKGRLELAELATIRTKVAAASRSRRGPGGGGPGGGRGGPPGGGRGGRGGPGGGR